MRARPDALGPEYGQHSLGIDSGWLGRLHLPAVCSLHHAAQLASSHASPRTTRRPGSGRKTVSDRQQPVAPWHLCIVSCSLIVACVVYHRAGTAGDRLALRCSEWPADRSVHRRLAVVICWRLSDTFNVGPSRSSWMRRKKSLHELAPSCATPVHATPMLHVVMGLDVPDPSRPRPRRVLHRW